MIGIGMKKAAERQRQMMKENMKRDRSLSHDVGTGSSVLNMENLKISSGSGSNGSKPVRRQHSHSHRHSTAAEPGLTASSKPVAVSFLETTVNNKKIDKHRLKQQLSADVLSTDLCHKMKTTTIPTSHVLPVENLSIQQVSKQVSTNAVEPQKASDTNNRNRSSSFVQQQLKLTSIFQKTDTKQAVLVVEPDKNRIKEPVPTAYSRGSEPDCLAAAAGQSSSSADEPETYWKAASKLKRHSIHTIELSGLMKR